MESSKKLTIVNPELSFKKVSLKTPTTHHYLLFAAEVDSGFFPLFLWSSRKKKKLLKYCKSQCQKIKRINGVEDAVVFKARLIPPGKGKLLRERPHIPVAKFDVLVLIEINDASIFSETQFSDYVKEIKQQFTKNSDNTLFLKAANARRIDSVDHNKQGTFLFNYFYADDAEQNLGIWEYTAGWFQEETGLDNSTLLLPDGNQESPYAVINHCRWDTLSDILPSLLFKKSFEKFVLENFYANNVAAIPILYKLA